MKKYREENKEKSKEYQIKYREENQEKLKQYKKEYRKENKAKKQETDKQYRENNKDEIAKRKNEKILCECGNFYKRDAKSSHRKSNKHFDNLIGLNVFNL